MNPKESTTCSTNEHAQRKMLILLQESSSTTLDFSYLGLHILTACPTFN